MSTCDVAALSNQRTAASFANAARGRGEGRTEPHGDCKLTDDSVPERKTRIFTQVNFQAKSASPQSPKKQGRQGPVPDILHFTCTPLLKALELLLLDAWPDSDPRYASAAPRKATEPWLFLSAKNLIQPSKKVAGAQGVRRSPPRCLL